MLSFVGKTYIGAIENFFLCVDFLEDLQSASSRRTRLVTEIAERYRENPIPLAPSGPLGGTTREAFVVQHKGSTYKVRHCRNVAKARLISRWLRYLERTEVSRFINKYHGRRGEVLVKAFVAGRQLLAFEKEEPEIAYKLGRFVGTTHGIHPPFWVTRRKADRCYSAFLHFLNQGDFSSRLANHIDLTFKKNCPDHLQLAVTTSSLKSPSNLIVSSDGGLCLIDHEHWEYDLPLSEVVPLISEVFDPQQRQAFLDGYESTGSTISAYSDQLVMTELFRLVRRYVYVMKMGMDKSVVKARIQALVDGAPFILAC